MFFQKAVGLLATSAVLASACAPELYKRDGVHPKHVVRSNIPNPITDNRGWSFDTSEEWNSLKEGWGKCMNGTQQSPIDFQSSWGVARKHAPKFNYPSGLKGTINNWDFGPQWAYDKNASNGEEPTMEFEENGKVEKVFFKSWHTHAPAEHKIDGYAPRAEIHFVHYDDKDVPRAVVGFFIDRLADAESDFFGSLPTYPTIFHNVTQENVPLDLNLAIQEAAGYRNYFTYQGSLTTPPCTEGLRWYISKDIIYVSDEQLQEILTASTFSARPVNPIWLHNVNGRDGPEMILDNSGVDADATP